MLLQNCFIVFIASCQERKRSTLGPPIPVLRETYSSLFSQDKTVVSKLRGLNFLFENHCLVFGDQTK